MTLLSRMGTPSAACGQDPLAVSDHSGVTRGLPIRDNERLGCDTLPLEGGVFETYMLWHSLLVARWLGPLSLLGLCLASTLE